MTKTKKSNNPYDGFVPPEIDWSQLENSNTSLRRRTRDYNKLSIADAFGKEYNVKLNPTDEYLASEESNLNPLKIGDVFLATVESIGKNHTLLSRNNSKESLKLKQNFAGWDIAEGDPVEVEVVGKEKTGEMIIDAIKPMKDNWVARVKSTLSNKFQSFIVDVEDLQVQKGGYVGRVNINPILELTGKPHYVHAFIPGSYITLNIEYDFDRWNGKTVKAMVMNFTDRNGEIGLICSRKKYLNSYGGQSLVNIYDAGFGRGTRFDQITFDGHVTGIINSVKKHGVFIEVTDYNITGLLERDPQDLVNYHIGDPIKVQIDRLDWDENKEPYKRDRDGILTEVNLKPVFVEVE